MRIGIRDFPVNSLEGPVSDAIRKFSASDSDVGMKSGLFNRLELNTRLSGEARQASPSGKGMAADVCASSTPVL